MKDFIKAIALAGIAFFVVWAFHSGGLGSIVYDAAEKVINLFFGFLAILAALAFLAILALVGWQMMHRTRQ